MNHADIEESLARSRADLRQFFAPGQGIAIIGRVDPAPIAQRLRMRYGRDIKLCFVNPKGGDAGEIPVFQSLAEVPDSFGVAVIRVGPANVPQVVRDCAANGISKVVVFSSGYSEIGTEGKALEATLAEVIAETGVRLIGPNTADNMFENFPVPAGHRGGAIGLITQSGAMGRPIVEGIAMGAAFTRWVTVGNETDIELADVVGHFVHDNPAAVIAGYVEGFKSLPRLRVALEQANQAGKPVVLLKIGESERGARMAASHTGHLAGNDAIVQGLFDQHGVTRVRDLDELLETANLFAKLPAETGSGAALYSVSGGTATLMAEIAERHEVDVPTLSAGTRDALSTLLPSYVSFTNPIDNGGQFTMNGTTDDRRTVFEILAADPAVDVIVVGFNAAFGLLSDNMAADVRAWIEAGGSKPVIAVWCSVVTEGAGYADLVASGVPIFRSLEKAFRALKAFSSWRNARPNFRRRTLEPIPITHELLSRPGVIGAVDAARLLSEAGVNMAREGMARSLADVAEVAESVGFPQVMKLASPDFPHRSDLGLVALDIPDKKVAVATFETLIARGQAANDKARIDGVQIQQQVTGGVEMLVGLIHDEHLGPALTIGAGGIFAEILRDVAVRPLPVDAADIREMIDGLRIAALLKGARGKPACNIDALVALALSVARLGISAGTHLAELDLNPVIVRSEDALVVDALVVAR